MYVGQFSGRGGSTSPLSKGGVTFSNLHRGVMFSILQTGSCSPFSIGGCVLHSPQGSCSPFSIGGCVLHSPRGHVLHRGSCSPFSRRGHVLHSPQGGHVLQTLIRGGRCTHSVSALLLVLCCSSGEPAGVDPPGTTQQSRP